MTMLILGARGMLGRALAAEFADQQPMLWDREELDITNQESVREKVGGGRWDVVINAAAYTRVDDAETRREEAMSVNADAVRWLAEAVKERGALLVHYSTDYIFPGDEPEGYTEDDKPGPAVNVYGETKLAGERALQEVAPRFYLLRTAWLYGSGGQNFVDAMLMLARERDTLSVVNDQHGSPTYTRDVARATRDLLTMRYSPGVYHIVNAGTTTWYGLAREIFRLAELPVQLTPVASGQFPRPAKRPAWSVLKNTRGPTLRPWPEAVRDYLTLTGKAP
ncbi:MAG: dTDP-4-dehydrorhamnose reductase [Candidatus Andersenbacteria bacterium]|nr:dTDP-4-dehydrorhamnose reductase [Candidatus Andersenbacteria bacterium]